MRFSSTNRCAGLGATWLTAEHNPKRGAAGARIRAQRYRSLNRDLGASLQSPIVASRMNAHIPLASDRQQLPVVVGDPVPARSVRFRQDRSGITAPRKLLFSELPVSPPPARPFLLSLAQLEMCEKALLDAEDAVATLQAEHRAALQSDIAELEAIRRYIDAQRREHALLPLRSPAYWRPPDAVLC